MVLGGRFFGAREGQTGELSLNGYLLVWNCRGEVIHYLGLLRLFRRRATGFGFP